MAEAKKDLSKATAEKLSGAEEEIKSETGDGEDTVTVSINVRGTDVDLVCPASFELADPDVLLYMEQERPTSAFKELIGETQWRRMKSLRWTSKDFSGFVEKWQATVGLGKN